MVKRNLEITILEFLTFIVMLVLAFIELNRFVYTQKVSPIMYAFANIIFIIILVIALIGYKVFYKEKDKEVEK